MVNPRRWGLSVSYMWSRSDSTEPEPDLRSRIPLQRNQRVSACALDNPRANWTPSHLERMRVPGSTARHFANARVNRYLVEMPKTFLKVGGWVAIQNAGLG